MFIARSNGYKIVGYKISDDPLLVQFTLFNPNGNRKPYQFAGEEFIMLGIPITHP